MLAGLACSSGLLWRCWKLERHVTLSPLETGRTLCDVIQKAQSGKPDLEIDGMLKAVGPEGVEWHVLSDTPPSTDDASKDDAKHGQSSNPVSTKTT